MSKQNRRIFLLIFLAVFSILAVLKIREWTLSIGVPIETKPVSDPLKAALSNLVSRYKSGNVAVIDISTVTTFPWDQLYIFGPYTDSSELDAMIGRTWRNNCVTQIETSDGYILLVFTNNDVVVHCLDYPRGENDFFIPPPGYESGFSPQEAVFILNEHGRIVFKDDK
jgi:hypothetical protein